MNSGLVSPYDRLACRYDRFYRATFTRRIEMVERIMATFSNKAGLSISHVLASRC